jgi:D-glycero-D-manno-heptose 1,7-bisphosphate phosphatase
MGLLCFDLDGTLVESALEEVDGKLGPRPGEIFTEPRLRPNVHEVVKTAAEEGDRFAIVTNQGGVAWGYATEIEAWARIGRAVALLDGFFSQPFSIHACFAHPRATIARYREGHERRKPSGAMIVEATATHYMAGGTDVTMVGDLDGDREAADAAGVEFIPAGTFFDL